jgi:hypothetical protein
LRTIEEIIEDWKVEYGTMAYGRDGAFYRYINFKIKKNLLLNLAQTMIDEGYAQEDLSSIKTTNLVVNGCEAPEGASSRAKSKIKKGKDITASQWKGVLREFFRGHISTFNPENREQELKLPEKKPEKELEINPSDRIKIDTSDIEDPPLDLEFLRELGVDESSVGGKNE